MEAVEQPGRCRGPDRAGPFFECQVLTKTGSMGPCTGSPWPCGARYTVTAKSPATGAYGYANGSGFFGREMRKTGYDLIVGRGRAFL